MVWLAFQAALHTGFPAALIGFGDAALISAVAAVSAVSAFNTEETTSRRS